MKVSTGKGLMPGGLSVLALVLAGCLFEESDAPPKITLQPVSQTVAYGDSVTFAVSVTAPPPLTFKWYVNGDTVLGAHDSTWKFAARADMNGIQVKCVVSNNNASITSATATLTVTGLTAWPSTDTTVTLGAQGAAAGSAVDLDSGRVYTVSQVSANAYARLPQIDLVYLYYDSARSLNGPLAARDSGVTYTLFTSAYTAAAADVRFVSVRAKPTTPQHARDAYLDGGAQRSARIAAGDKFIVRTTENRYVYVEVLSSAGTAAATAGLSLSVSTFILP